MAVKIPQFREHARITQSVRTMNVFPIAILITALAGVRGFPTHVNLMEIKPLVQIQDVLGIQVNVS